MGPRETKRVRDEVYRIAYGWEQEKGVRILSAD